LRCEVGAAPSTSDKTVSHAPGRLLGLLFQSRLQISSLGRAALLLRSLLQLQPHVALRVSLILLSCERPLQAQLLQLGIAGERHSGIPRQQGRSTEPVLVDARPGAPPPIGLVVREVPSCGGTVIHLCEEALRVRRQAKRLGSRVTDSKPIQVAEGDGIERIPATLRILSCLAAGESICVCVGC